MMLTVVCSIFCNLLTCSRALTLSRNAAEAIKGVCISMQGFEPIATDTEEPHAVVGNVRLSCVLLYFRCVGRVICTE